VTVVASHTTAHEPVGTQLPPDPYGRFKLLGQPLLALTQDEQLLETLKKMTNATHEVRAAASEIDFSAALLAHHAGVAVLDCAAVATPIAQLTQRLQAQFPELVLIVAGSIDEQAMLAAQITDGSVHRFLHKPVSEQRVRLFVEAAWRRYEEAHAAPSATSAASAGRRGRSDIGWALLAACAVIAGPLAWIGTHPSLPAPHAARASPAASPAPSVTVRADPALESLLSRAAQALNAGRLATPAGASAADLYREALRRNARDPRALKGLEQVIGRLLSGAEAQLQQGHLDAAQRLAGEARAISPDHPRVAFLMAQIDAQRERGVLDDAQRAAASGHVSAALAALDDAAHDGHRSTLIAEAREELAQKQLDTRVADYLGQGRAALSRGQLIAPVEDNARFYIDAARALAPADPRVQEAAQDLIARLESEARQALAEKDAERAELWTAAAADAGADPTQVDALRQLTRELRLAARADGLAHLALSFNQRLAQGHIDEPQTDSAKFYLAQLMQADPANPSVLQARSAYGARVLEEAGDALRAQDFPAAHHWLAEARAAGADSAATAAQQAALTAAEGEARQANTYVSESTLTRTRYVAPTFPVEARQRGIDGWVDLHFVVGTDGAVSDVEVVGAQPVGMFEQAALDAVRRWRYQPVVRGGRTVSQRAGVRLRFTVRQ
jgi:TonB family protein